MSTLPTAPPSPARMSVRRLLDSEAMQREPGTFADR